MSRFNAVDLAKLAPPPVVEVISYEDILAGMVTDYLLRNPDYDVSGLESDPVKKVLETAAYRETVLRARVNQAARAVMLAFSQGDDLPHLSALFSVERLLIEEGDPDATPPVPDVYEDDDRLRERTQLSLEAYSTAGPYGAYTYYGLSASGLVKDLGVYGPESEVTIPGVGTITPGQVAVFVLSTEDDGTASAELLAEVLAAFEDEDRRPLTDQVFVKTADVTAYTIELEVEARPGEDPTAIEEAVETAVAAYAEIRHRVGARVSLAGIAGSAFVAGVENVSISDPEADLPAVKEGAYYCTGVTVTVVEAT